MPDHLAFGLRIRSSVPLPGLPPATDGEPDIVVALARLAKRTRRSILFTVAPRTPLLTLMHFAGRIFPRGNRAPAIVPVEEQNLRRHIAADAGLAGWKIVRTGKVMTGFYKSQAFELARA